MLALVAGSVMVMVDPAVGAVVVVVAGPVEAGTVVGGTAVVVVVAVGTVVVVVVVGRAHRGLVTVLESKVVAPFRASNRRSKVAFVFALIEVNARMVPTNLEPTPSVEELPTCQKTLQAWAPLASVTPLLVEVMSVDPAWKMKTASGSP